MSSSTDTENGIPLDTAAIVSTVLEGILYGESNETLLMHEREKIFAQGFLS